MKHKYKIGQRVGTGLNGYPNANITEHRTDGDTSNGPRYEVRLDNGITYNQFECELIPVK